jgi:hypothetical protein
MLPRPANHDIESPQSDRLEASIGNGREGYFHVEGDSVNLTYHQPDTSRRPRNLTSPWAGQRHGLHSSSAAMPVKLRSIEHTLQL